VVAVSLTRISVRMRKATQQIASDGAAVGDVWRCLLRCGGQGLEGPDAELLADPTKCIERVAALCRRTKDKAGLGWRDGDKYG